MAGRIQQKAPSSPTNKEGFLCPICLQDLGSAASLARHFESGHSEGTDVLDQVKGFFGKAKKFFKQDDDLMDDLNFNEHNGRDRSSSRLSQSFYFEPQELGQTRKHTDFYRALRDTKIDKNMIETNKIVIRMCKLTADDNVPEDTAKRKVLEQKIVPWVDDKLVKNCYTCGRSFNITRRRHHCRLCGQILCNTCSDFLPFSQARLIGKAAASSELSFGQTLVLPRRGSDTSLNSLGNQEIGPVLRICSKCRKLLEGHRIRQIQKYSIPKLVALYEKLQNAKRKAEEIVPEYCKVASSLRSGETVYTLNKAAELRQQIAKFYSEMEMTSKKIIGLSSSEEEESTDGTVKLALYIRTYTISYIQERSAELPKLPDEKQLELLIAQREEERKRKVAKELEEAQLKAETSIKVQRPVQVKTDHHVVNKPQEKPAVGADGWKPGDVDARHVKDEDPMIQQMNIIRTYLKQAKQVQKWDEVEMLEENLRHLEEEYDRQCRDAS